MRLFGTSTWRDVVSAKQKARATAIDEGLEAAGPETVQDKAYLAATACEIATNIADGQWTAGQVVRAYIRRAALVHSLCNCLTEVRFKVAIVEADALDASYASSNTTRGRLHGVPLSVKEQFNVAGYDSSNGYSAWANKPAEQDAGLVRILRAEGAIVIAKTNVPQTLMFFECVNPVFGRTSNPWNLKHTSGGSSGGEAALLAADGSAIGIGTDIGGSLRIPTSWCGVYSLKPSLGRITRTGIAHTCPGFDSIALISGPMGRSVADVELVARVAFGRGARAWEALPPVAYRDVSLPARLRFGYYTFDGCIKPSPATERAVMETVAALRAAGHDVVEFVPPDVNAAVELFAGFTSADGYSTVLAPIGNDPKEEELFLITLGPKLPGFVRSITGWLVTKTFGDEKFSSNLASSRTKSVAELYALHAARDAYIQRWYDEVWDKDSFDGIIAPAQAIPAPPHTTTKMAPQLSVSMFLWNVLDFPTGALPVTRVESAKDALTPEWLASGPRDGIMVERTLYHAAAPLYDAKRMEGLPLGVQVVGRRWEDEKVLAMMHIVDDALGKRSFGPGAWTP